MSLPRLADAPTTLLRNSFSVRDALIGGCGAKPAEVLMSLPGWFAADATRGAQAGNVPDEGRDRALPKTACFLRLISAIRTARPPRDCVAVRPDVLVFVPHVDDVKQVTAHPMFLAMPNPMSTPVPAPAGGAASRAVEDGRAPIKSAKAGPSPVAVAWALRARRPGGRDRGESSPWPTRCLSMPPTPRRHGLWSCAAIASKSSISSPPAAASYAATSI